MKRFTLTFALALIGCTAKTPIPAPPPAQICVETLQDVQQGSNVNIQVSDQCQGGEAVCQCYQASEATK